MGATIAYAGTLVTTSCWCGIALAIPSSLEAEARRIHSTEIHCPLGHTFVYTGDTEAERLRKELQRERDRRAATAAERDQALATLRTTKGVVTKLRKRVAFGVCPFGCRRHFVDLERHVATRHPGQKLEGEGTT